jgi:cytochrome o ubiquinol oxidase subunit 1
MKQRGVAYRPPARYEDIVVPKNSAFGVVIGGLAFAFGFAAVWHLWWLMIAAAVLIAVTLIVRSSDDDTTYVLPAAEVEKIENRRLKELAPERQAEPRLKAAIVPSEVV